MIKLKPIGDNYGVQLSKDVDITDLESEKYVNEEIAKKAIAMEKDLNLSILLEPGPKFTFVRSISGEFNETSIKEFKDNIKQFMSWLIKQELPKPQKDEIVFVKDLPEPDMLDIQFAIVCKDGFVPGHISPELFARMINAYLEKYDKDNG